MGKGPGTKKDMEILESWFDGGRCTLRYLLAMYLRTEYYRARRKNKQWKAIQSINTADLREYPSALNLTASHPIACPEQTSRMMHSLEISTRHRSKARLKPPPDSKGPSILESHHSSLVIIIFSSFPPLSCFLYQTFPYVFLYAVAGKASFTSEYETAGVHLRGRTKTHHQQTKLLSRSLFWCKTTQF